MLRRKIFLLLYDMWVGGWQIFLNIFLSAMFEVWKYVNHKKKVE